MKYKGSDFIKSQYLTSDDNCSKLMYLLETIGKKILLHSFEVKCLVSLSLKYSGTLSFIVVVGILLRNDYFYALYLI